MKKLLIVEDDATFLRILSDTLSKQFQIYEARGVNDALHNLEKNKVDLICSDYNMLDGTGLDLLRQLNKSGQKIPFILMSGIEDSFVVNSVRNYGGIFCDKADPDLISTIGNMINVE